MAGTGKPPARIIVPTAIPTQNGDNSQTVNWGLCGGTLVGSVFVFPVTILSAWIGNTASALVSFSCVSVIYGGDVMSVIVAVNGANQPTSLVGMPAGNTLIASATNPVASTSLEQTFSCTRLFTESDGLVPNLVNRFMVFCLPTTSAQLTGVTDSGSLVVQPLS